MGPDLGPAPPRRLYHQFQFCYSKCEHGYMQELLQRSSEVVDHFCVYNFQGECGRVRAGSAPAAIKDKFGCLTQLDQALSQSCLRTCTMHHNAVTSLMQNFKNLALNGDSSQAERYLAEGCE